MVKAGIAWLARIGREAFSLYLPNRYRIHRDLPSGRDAQGEGNPRKDRMQRPPAAHRRAYSLEQVTSIAAQFLTSTKRGNQYSGLVMVIEWCLPCNGYHLAMRENGDHYV